MKNKMKKLLFVAILFVLVGCGTMLLSTEFLITIVILVVISHPLLMSYQNYKHYKQVSDRTLRERTWRK